MLRSAATMLIVGILAMLLPGSAPAARAQTGKTYQARLSALPVDGPPMMATIAGNGSVTAVVTGTRLTITGTFTALKSAATQVKIHRAMKGVRGPAVLDLPPPTRADAGEITGTVELTPSQMDDLERERLYVQLSSEKAPDGNLWGWLLPVEDKR